MEILKEKLLYSPSFCGVIKLFTSFNRNCDNSSFIVLLTLCDFILSVGRSLILDVSGLPRIGSCALTNVKASYGPDGYMNTIKMMIYREKNKYQKEYTNT